MLGGVANVAQGRHRPIHADAGSPCLSPRGAGPRMGCLARAAPWIRPDIKRPSAISDPSRDQACGRGRPLRIGMRVGCARARRVGHVPSIRRDRRMPRAKSDRRHANGPPPAKGRPAGVAERAVDQSIDWPPLAEIVDPVMKPASSDTRNTTQRAISSGSPRRPTGMPPMIISRTFSGTAITMSVAM